MQTRILELTKATLRRIIQLAAIMLWSAGVIVIFPFLMLKHLLRKHILKRKPNILWGPTSIINIKYNSQSAKLAGYRSSTLVFDVYHINSPEDFDYCTKNWWRYSVLRKIKPIVIPYFVSLWTIWSYDIFNFFFHGGLLQNTPLRTLELPVLKLLRKRVVASPYGNDMIMPSKVKYKYKWNVSLEIEKNKPNIDENRVFSNIKYVSKYADWIITGGDAIDYLVRADMSLHTVPLDLEECKPYYQQNERPKIVHAPNHRALKGTKYLFDVCERLKSKGYDFDLVLVEGMRNAEAREIYKSADIIADQFLIGWYGLFAIEGMALGKPVMCYMREEWLEYHSGYFCECPVVSTNPDNLEENLIMLLENPELRLELGRNGREYVEKYHSYEFIGNVLDKIYRKIWFKEDVDDDLRKMGIKVYGK